MNKIFEEFTDFSWVVNEYGVYTYVSGKTQELMGYKSYEIIGKKPFYFMSNTEATRVKKIYFELLKTKSPIVNLENTYISKSGKKICLLINGKAVYNEDGNFIGYCGVNKDITKLKKLKEELSMRDNFFQTIFNTSKDSIAILDIDSNFLLVNDSYENMTAYTKEELYTKACIDMTADEYKDELRIILSKVISKGYNEGYEKKCIRKDGKLIDVIIDMTLMDDKKTILTVAKDVTQKNLEQAFLIQQSRMAQMGKMISMIAHQWKQPLSIISAISSEVILSLELDVYTKDKIKDGMQDINTQIKYLSNTVDDFRNFYNPNKKAVKTTLSSICDKALSIINPVLNMDNIILNKDCEDEDMFNMYDNEMIQVFLNILKNAVDNFKDRKILNPKLSIHSRKNRIDICDNGGGIKAEVIDKIFDAYLTTKIESKGTGLGLYTSKIIIEKHHNGILSVSNKNDGVCFSITLPN